MSDAVRDEIEADLAEYQVPGISWAVLDGGEIVDRDPQAYWKWTVPTR